MKDLPGVPDDPGQSWREEVLKGNGVKEATMHTRRWQGRSCLVAVAILVLLVGPGCLPGVGWLPDSSGFVYTGGKAGRQLLHHDRAAGKSTVLVENVGGMAWPAVSPDGKRIAVALWATSQRERSLVVQIYDRAGKMVHRSKELERETVEPSRAQRGGLLPLVGWSAEGDRLVVGSPFKSSHVYDLKTRKVVSLKQRQLALFGSSAARPDGKAFVAWGKDGFDSVDFAGKPRRLDGDAELRKDMDKPGAASQKWGAMLTFPFVFDSQWEGSVATVAWRDSRLRLDTAKGTVATEEHKSPRTTDGKVIRQAHAFKSSTVRVVELRAPTKDDQNAVVPCRVEVARGKKADVVVAEAGLVKLFPSPDGKLVAVRWFRKPPGNTEEAGMGGLLLIDAGGKVVWTEGR
jgi:hypothetical protein